MHWLDTKQTPIGYSQLTVDFEEYLGELLAENERLIQQNQEQAVHFAHAFHNLRGTLTNMNLKVYLLEHGKPEQYGLYVDSLKASITEMTHMLDDLMMHMRQAAGMAETND
ncbi:MAG: hypothetical protein K8L97_06855 [Anaerolineae bacterium]|nr:hypothetical protein [Anaerolineae bacterium]